MMDVCKCIIQMMPEVEMSTQGKSQSADISTRGHHTEWCSNKHVVWPTTKIWNFWH